MTDPGDYLLRGIIAGTYALILVFTAVFPVVLLLALFGLVSSIFSGSPAYD